MSHSWWSWMGALALALSCRCVEEPLGTVSSAAVCQEAVSPDAQGRPRNAAGFIRYCWPAEPRCFCDGDNDCYAESGYVPCTPVTDAGASLDAGACAHEPTTPDNQGRPRNAAGFIRYCWPGELHCFCDSDNDCYAESGYVPCTASDAGAPMDVPRDIVDVRLDVVDEIGRCPPEPTSPDNQGRPRNAAGFIRYCWPAEPRCFCDGDNDCYAESGYVPCAVSDAGAPVDVPRDIVDVPRDVGVVDVGGGSAPRIVIDTTVDRGAISRDLYGVNLESTSQNVPEVRAFAGQYPLLRFPAGDEPAEFLWRDENHGPCGDRWTWSGVAELAAARGMGLILETNLLRGSPSDAANWIADARARGLRVACVNIGNETWGDWDADYRSASTYAQDLRDYAAALRARVPGTRVAASFGTFNEDGWNREVVRRAGDVIDAVDLHWYPNHREYARAIPSEIMAESEAIPQLLARVRGILRDEAPSRASQIEVMLGEYDCAEDPPRSGPVPGVAYSQWGMPNAVCYAGILGELIVGGVRTALYYEVQNARFGALQGKECDPGDFRIIRPKALAQQLYRDHFGERLVDVTAQNIPRYYSDGPLWWDGYAGWAPYVRAYASLANGGRSLRVIVLSRYETEAIPVTIELRGFTPSASAQAWELAGDSLRATNENVGGPVDAVRIVPRALTVGGATFVYTAPPHSVTALELTRAP